MLKYLRPPATQRRNLEDRLGRVRAGPRSDSTSGSRSRTRSRREPEGKRAADAILNAGRGSRRGLDVEPEAERAADLILDAQDESSPETEEAVRRIKEAGPERRDTREENEEDE